MARRINLEISLARHGKKKIRFGSGGKKIEDFVDPNKDPHSYLKRFILEENYRDWFNRNYPIAPFTMQLD